MITMTRRVEFDAGHRLIGHESKCRNVHGHRYVALIEVSAKALDDVGRIIDFGVVKEIVGDWIDEKWDHGFIYQVTDEIGEAISTAGMKTFVMDEPPTAENMSMFLLQKAQVLLAPHDVKVTRVRLFETPNCYADAYA